MSGYLIYKRTYFRGVYFHCEIMICMYGVLPPYRTLNSVRLAKAKYVVWSQDMSHVAILGRNGEGLGTHHSACTFVICAPQHHIYTCTEVAHFSLKNDCFGELCFFFCCVVLPCLVFLNISWSQVYTLMFIPSPGYL